ncbi:hypothetical protein C882_1044 [Caenispirillum salinarum AK4]|uniref:SIR2-like domain-containing protein n=2 Tax=Caenispirillum TaxID=414051 RepID=K9HBW7_9PROT|nr:hypothetical protein C882_1044 [Caenispirillum salinarum AK4]
MTEADRVLKSADAFFCVGYGFNDVHVQLYLNQALRQRPKPLVMISWGLTENAQAAITQASKDLRYCVMTRADDGSGTVVRTHEHRDGVFIEGLDTWSFDGFAREYL